MTHSRGWLQSDSFSFPPAPHLGVGAAFWKFINRRKKIKLVLPVIFRSISYICFVLSKITATVIFHFLPEIPSSSCLSFLVSICIPTSSITFLNLICHVIVLLKTFQSVSTACKIKSNSFVWYRGHFIIWPQFYHSRCPFPYTHSFHGTSEKGGCHRCAFIPGYLSQSLWKLIIFE